MLFKLKYHKNLFLIITFIILNGCQLQEPTKTHGILFLENRLMDSKLEFDYLSSSEKLLEYQRLYFENLLQKKTLNEIKILEISNKKVNINDLTILNKNE